MGKIIVAIIATILFGYVGFIIGAMLNLEGYLGVIFSIAMICSLYKRQRKRKLSLKGGTKLCRIKRS